MNKINGFTITKLSVSGFKCFLAPVSFDFGDITFINASNGLGKSSIADAIAFAFIGTPFYGEKGLDRLHNKNESEMFVSVDFIDDAGEPHNMTRYRKRDVTTAAFDGYNVKQSDLYTAFGDKDVFLSILNPLYFINVLGDTGKILLEKLLPVVNHAEVLAALPASSRELLGNQTLLSPEAFIKNRRSDLKDLEDKLIGYRSQKELLDYQRKERSEKLKEMQVALDEIVIKMRELEDTRNNGFNKVHEESILTELRKQRDELLGDTGQKATAVLIQNVLAEIKSVEASLAKQEAVVYTSPYIAEITEAEAALRVLYDEHNRMNIALSNTVVGYKCPTCAAIITSKNIEVIKTDLQHRFKALVNEGKIAKSALTSLKVQDSLERGRFEERKVVESTEIYERLNMLNQQLREIYIARELDAEDYSERLASIDNLIRNQEQRINNGNLTHEQVLRFVELEKSRQAYSVKISTLNEITDYDYSSLIAETEEEILRLNRLINEAIQYIAKRAEMMFEGLKMDKTEIVLTEVVKTTGEIKDCFRFSYDGRDYKCLSLSEKVRAGLEVSLLVQRLSGRNYPIFVDNSESICKFDNIQPTGQMVLSRVVKNQELQVTCKSRGQQNMVA